MIARYSHPTEANREDRQVGVALRHLPNPEADVPFHSDNVPWQRVINARGAIAPRLVIIQATDGNAAKDTVEAKQAHADKLKDWKPRVLTLKFTVLEGIQ